jgi:hypothetical protein
MFQVKYCSDVQLMKLEAFLNGNCSQAAKRFKSDHRAKSLIIVKTLFLGKTLGN